MRSACRATGTATTVLHDASSWRTTTFIEAYTSPVVVRALRRSHMMNATTTTTSDDHARKRERIAQRAGSVMVGSNLDAHNDEALRQGAMWAAQMDAPLAIVHALASPNAVTPLLARIRPPAEEGALLRATVEAAERHVRAQVDEDVPFDTLVEQGTPHAVLVRLAERHEPRVMVVGSSERALVTRVLLGATSEQVVRHAPCPVLVAKPSPPEGPVVAATDLSPWSASAVAAASNVARCQSTRLYVAHALDVAPPLIAGLDPPAPLDEEGCEQLEHAARELIDATLEQHGITGEPHVLVGQPVRSLVEFVAEVQARLLVVASHGHSQIRRLALGSTAEELVRRAPCSVLVTRG